MPEIVALENLEFAQWIRPGETVMWGQANAEPLPLTQTLMRQRNDVGHFRVVLGIDRSATCQVEHADCVEFISYCGAGANRALADAGVLRILPSHYSTFAKMLANGELRVDVLILQVAPADREGRYSLSLSCEYLLGCVDNARLVIAEVNEQAPWTYGERTLEARDLDVIVHTNRPLNESRPATLRETDQLIASHIAGLVDDGATLQTGIGSIPDAALSALAQHRDLGVHSGSLSDGIAALMQAGAITNRRKPIDPGISVGGVLMGSEALYTFAHNNPAIALRATQYTHDADVLANFDRFVSINSAVEVDLTGQINSEVASGSYVGAVGGALDFTRAAHRSRGGLPIIALPATAGTQSRIVHRISGPVTIGRSDAGLIVTEFGVADLRGLTLDQRVKKMLAIAHPAHRAALEHAIETSSGSRHA